MPCILVWTNIWERTFKNGPISLSLQRAVTPELSHTFLTLRVLHADCVTAERDVDSQASPQVCLLAPPTCLGPIIWADLLPSSN